MPITVDHASEDKHKGQKFTKNYAYLKVLLTDSLTMHIRSNSKRSPKATRELSRPSEKQVARL